MKTVAFLSPFHVFIVCTLWIAPIIFFQIGESGMVCAQSLTDAQRELVKRANQSLNSLKLVEGRFHQDSNGSRRISGTFYLSRPGRIRFQYDPPVTYSIRSDGSSVLVEDSALGTKDVYALAQTPLKILLAKNVNLLRDVNIRNVSTDPKVVNIVVSEKSAFRRGLLTIQFTRPDFELRGWRIRDTQGRTTTLAIQSIRNLKKLDPGWFRIQYDQLPNFQR